MRVVATLTHETGWRVARMTRHVAASEDQTVCGVPLGDSVAAHISIVPKLQAEADGAARCTRRACVKAFAQMPGERT